MSTGCETRTTRALWSAASQLHAAIDSCLYVLIFSKRRALLLYNIIVILQPLCVFYLLPIRDTFD